MLICNFVYEKQGAKRKKVMNYRTALPRDQVFGWDDVKVFMLGQYILMHSVSTGRSFCTSAAWNCRPTPSTWTTFLYTSRCPT